MISSYYRTNSIGLELWLPVIKHWYQAITGQTVMTTCNKTMISSYYRTNSIGLELWLPVIKHWYQALPGQTVLV
jgi:hypothetical protein